METYDEWKIIKKWLKERRNTEDLTKEEINTYIKVIKMMRGRCYECLDCPRNDGNLQKGECYNCYIWDD